MELVAAVAVQGRIVDAQGSPVAEVAVLGVCEEGRCLPFPGSSEHRTDRSGHSDSPNHWLNRVPIGKSTKLQIRLRDGFEQQVVAVPQSDGSFTAKLGRRGHSSDKNRSDATTSKTGEKEPK